MENGIRPPAAAGQVGRLHAAAVGRGDVRPAQCTTASDAACTKALPPYGCGVPLAGCERLAGWQVIGRHRRMHRFPDLSLRGPSKGPWRPEREARGSARVLGCNLGKAATVSAIGFPRCCRVLRDRCHVASLLAMTRQGGAAMHQRPDAVELPCTRRSESAATDAIGAYHFNDSLYELHCLPRLPRRPPASSQ